MIVMTDMAGIVTYASSSFGKPGYAPEAFVGCRVLDHIHPDDVDRVRETFRDLLYAVVDPRVRLG